MSRIWVALALLVMPALAAAQTISSVDGSVDADSTITIIGSGFGYKGAAAPVIWDHLDNIPEYAGMGDGDSGFPVRADGDCPTCPYQQEEWGTFYWEEDANEIRVPGRPCYLFGLGDGDANWFVRDFGLDGTNGTAMFIDWWFKTPHDFSIADGGGGSTKFVRVNSGDVSYQSQSWVYARYTRAVDDDHDGDCDRSAVASGGAWHDAGAGNFNSVYGDVWVHLAMEVSNRPDHTAGYGEVRCYFNNNTRHDILFCSDDPVMKLAAFGLQDNSGGWPGDSFYMGEVYVDTTLARVALGDASSWASVSHYEMQIPTYWATDGDSVQVTVNTGTFSTDDTAYLFVFDAGGNPSAGEQVTIGETYEGESPPAGTPAAPDTVYVEGALDQ